MLRAPFGLELHKMHIYTPWGHFEEHSDTRYSADHVGNRDCYPFGSPFTGGDLVVQHLGRTTTIRAPSCPNAVTFATFFADCMHKVEPVTSGCRVVLQYSISFKWRSEETTATPMSRPSGHTVEAVRANAAFPIALGLNHQYVLKSLTPGLLKTSDRDMYDTFMACPDLKWTLKFVILRREERLDWEAEDFHGRGDDEGIESWHAYVA